MDRQAWIVVILCFIGLFVWQFYYASRYIAPPTESEEVIEEVVDADAPPTSEPAPPVEPPADAPELEPTEPEIEEQTAVLSNEVVEFIFTNRGAGIREAVLYDHMNKEGEPIRLNKLRRLPIGALGFEDPFQEGETIWRMSEQTGAIVFRRTEGPIEITKRYRWPDSEDAAENYVLLLDVQFKNVGEGDVYRSHYFLNVGSATPLRESEWATYTGFDWYREGKFHHVDVNWFGEGRIPLLGIQTRSARPVYSQTNETIIWAAVKNQFYATLITTLNLRADQVQANRFELPREENQRSTRFGIEGLIGLPSLHLEPGDLRRDEFQIYAGPREYQRLVALGNDEAELMHFGMFKWISQFLLNSLNWLYGLTGNYAFAIILLTVCIRLAMWPLQNKATMSMKRMAAIAPKMQELREKYKDDPTRMNQELMGLYKKYKINPFGGCLPMLVQLPIFFGFYWMLATAVELRNNGFLWISDLSQPDTIFTIFGFPVNPLPLLMAGTMLWQMHVTPKTGDTMQRRIMLVLPVIFLIFCYNFASALALYWTVQNLVSIVQLYVTRNQPVPTLEEMTPPTKSQQRRQEKLMKKSKKRRPNT